MITIKALGSSSAGNAYWVSDGFTPLLFEAGLTYRTLQIGTNFHLSGVKACLITHEHLDHCKAVRDLLKKGFEVYASSGTWGALGITHHRAHTVEPLKPFRVGTWKVMAFDVQHDVSEPVGYLAQSDSGERLVFLTDTYYCKYRFRDLTHIMVEANFSEAILRRNVADGRVAQSLSSRLLRSHFSLENVKDFLKANDLTKVQEIWLLHLSDTNSDEELFKREIQEISGCPVYVAKRG